ncbi:hypothetical protein ABG768_006784, partial [Culter alburnus]
HMLKVYIMYKYKSGVHVTILMNFRRNSNSLVVAHCKRVLCESTMAASCFSNTYALHTDRTRTADGLCVKQALCK